MPEIGISDPPRARTVQGSCGGRLERGLRPQSTKTSRFEIPDSGFRLKEDSGCRSSGSRIPHRRTWRRDLAEVELQGPAETRGGSDSSGATS